MISETSAVPEAGITPEQAGARAQAAIQQFAESLPNIVRRDRADGEEAGSERVYHYTNLGTLLAVVAPDEPYVNSDSGDESSRFRAVWATSARYMNDAKEFEQGKDVLIRICERIAQEPGSPATLLELVQRAADHADGLDVYCACFSRVGDDLGQWRGYGDNGRGCAIAFDLDELQNRINGLGVWVVYCDTEDLGSHEEISGRIVRDLVSALSALRPGEAAAEAEFDRVAEAELVQVLPAICLVFKNDHFRSEEEYRVIYSDKIAEDPLLLRGGGDRHRWFRRAGSAVIPFVKLTCEGRRLPVREVKLGPAAKFETNRKSVRMMLDLCALGSIEVTESAIPFLPHG